MSHNLKIILPCKPVVWQYLTNKYGTAPQLPDDDWIKLLAVSLLKRNLSKDDKDITLQYYTRQFEIPITLDEFQRYGDVLSKTSIRQINNRIEDLIHQQLYQFLEFYVHVAGYQLNAAIEMFQQMYAFPPEIYTHDAIKKYYQRKIQPYLTLQKFVGVNVPFKLKKSYRRAC